jgi:hypothetical protein
MRLVSVEVENFGAIRDASVAFGPGLNILYGPNDLGKSTLAEAIRLALLLPSTSTVHEPWVPWSGSHRPTVDLVFWANGLHWKVRKEFGPGNHAWLQKSADGVALDEVAKARGVDAKIREILSWGIPDPGGSNAPRGLPMSFLATALLSTQADAASVLAASLEADGTDTGRQRVTSALSALAQDPLFKKLIDAANERYDQAFTAPGKKKMAADGVLRIAADRVRDARGARDEAQQIVSSSASVMVTLSGAIARRDEATRKAKDAADALKVLLELRQWGVAKREVDRIATIAADIAQLASKRTVLERVRDQGKLDVDRAEVAIARSREQLKKAEVDAVPGAGDTAAAEIVERQRLELALADADRRRSDAAGRMDAIAVVRQRVADVEVARSAVESARERVAEAEQALVMARSAEDGLRIAVGRLDLVERHLDLRDAEAVIAQAVALRQAFAETAAEAARLRAKRADLVVPDRKTLSKIRTLASDLAVARGKLEVGLAVTVDPVAARDVIVALDGGPARAEHVTDPWTVEARGRVEIVLQGVAAVRVVAGNAEVREKAARIATRWTDEAEAILAAAGVATAEGLAAKIDDADAIDRDLRSAQATLDDLRAKIEALADDDARRHAAEARIAIGDATGFDADRATLGRDPRASVRAKRAALAREIGQSKVASLETDWALRKQEATTAAQRYADATRIRDVALAAQGVDLDDAAIRSALATATSDLAVTRTTLDGLDKALATRRTARDALLAGARKSVTDAGQALEGARATYQNAVEAVAGLAGRIDALRGQMAATNAVDAQTRLDVARAALAGPGREVTDREIDAAKLERDRTARALDAIVAEVHRLQGALEQTGGAVAADRLRDAEDALQLAEQHEHDIGADYEAWRLLRDTLAAAEAAQASHLGQALGPVIAERFAALTTARYGRLAMTAQLATEGVVVGGQVRNVDRLSVGTREQLSTLYRICLAERLQSAVVLDDQLVQSDVVRLDWFRALLREKARAFQIVILTCRPHDYVPADALAPLDRSYRDVDEGWIRTVDLGRAVRHPSGA